MEMIRWSGASWALVLLASMSYFPINALTSGRMVNAFHASVPVAIFISCALVASALTRFFADLMPDYLSGDGNRRHVRRLALFSTIWVAISVASSLIYLQVSKPWSDFNIRFSDYQKRS
jgi:hypothetical protein